ncbi:MAG: hypothetical protein CR991_06655 [Proteobacteria bacterium]|nr:MAG: hypothetical protein CR991_06655 [Pseudomonadota bacterium]
MNKSLKLAIKQGVIFLALAQAGSAAYANGVEYSIKWDDKASVYRVFMRPQTAPKSPNLTYSAQVTIKVPHAESPDQFVAQNITSTNENLSWSNSSKVRAPIANPSYDYLSFTTSILNNAKTFPWVAGEELEVFNFSNGGACLGSVEIMDNDADPFALNPSVPSPSDPDAKANPGNEFSSDGWGGDLDNDFLGRYGVAADCSVATVGNASPVAAADTVVVESGQTITIDVLKNDTDDDGDTLSIASVTQGAHGSVTISDNNTITYTPEADYSGADNFTYMASDGKGGSSTGSVSVTVSSSGNNPPNGTNENPTAVGLTATTRSNTAITINVLNHVSDPDGDIVTLSNYSNGSFGTVSLSDGKLIYTPQNAYVGEDSFSYTVSDGKGGTAVGQITVRVLASDTPVSSAVKAVPTLSQWGQLLLALLLGGLGFRRFSRSKL